MPKVTRALTCIECGEAFTTTAPNATRCSMTCKRRAERQRRARRRTRPCEACGEMFAPVSERSKVTPQRFCSLACADAWKSDWATANGVTPPLPVPFSRRQRAAADLARAARGTQGGTVLTAGACLICGLTIVRRTRGAVAGFTCSRQCYDLAKNAVRDEIRQAERRAIFRRDLWTCQLCSQPIDPDLPAGDPMSATIDHVYPVSLGGGDEPSNLQAAHMRCNSRKGNRLDSDLVLTP